MINHEQPRKKTVKILPQATDPEGPDIATIKVTATGTTKIYFHYTSIYGTKIR